MRLSQLLTLVGSSISLTFADESIRLQQQDPSNNNNYNANTKVPTSINGISYPYKESLNLTPLERNNLLAKFDFQMNSSEFPAYPQKEEPHHYSVFSKLLGPILESTNTRELHLRFSQGWYDSEVYGKLPEDGIYSGGTGVELWSLLESESKEDAFHNWMKLSNSLSGLFCASLNFIDSRSTTYPVSLFTPESSFLDNVSTKDNLYLLRSALPREPVCTENLTPFLKLLPTKGKAGISSLLTGHKVFNSQWSSMSIDITTECTDEDSCYYSMKQSISLILNVPKTLERNENPIPKPIKGSDLRCDTNKKFDSYHCFPLGEPTEIDFTLEDLFGKTISGGSLISQQPSTVCSIVDLNNWEVSLITLAEPQPITNQVDDTLCFELDTVQDYNVQFKTSHSDSIKPISPPPIVASRSLSGYSQDAGGFRIDLYNPTNTEEQIVIFETLPWFTRIYLHTLKISINDTTTYLVTDPGASQYLNEIIYNPSIDRLKPSHLELLVSLPAKTKLKLSLEFDKAMLLYAEYPPDANHGFEIEPAVIAVIDPVSNKVKYQMRTTTALLTLPTPDFSMPYNVIILTSTVMSLAFGAVFNLICKRTVTEDVAELIVYHSAVSKFTRTLKLKKQKVVSWLANLKGKQKSKNY